MRSDPAARALYQLKPGQRGARRDRPRRRVRRAALRAVVHAGADDPSRRRSAAGATRRRRRRDARRAEGRASSRRRCSAPPTRSAFPTRSRWRSPRCSPATSTSTTTFGAATASRCSTRRSYVDGEPAGTGRVARRRVREPRPGAPRVPVGRARRERRLLHRGRPHDAQGVPALADGVLARDAAASRSRVATRSSTPGARTRASTTAAPDGHADPRHRERRRRLRRTPGRLRQRRRSCATADRTRRSTRTCRASRTPAKAGARVSQGETIGYVGADRLGDRPAPALRVPRRRRAAQPADGRAAGRRAGAGRAPRRVRRSDRARGRAARAGAAPAGDVVAGPDTLAPRLSRDGRELSRA